MEWFDPDYWLGRLVLERGIASIYLIAFLGAALQFRPLIGARGMLPVPRYLQRRSLRTTPTVFQLHYSDRFFAATCWAGVLISAGIVVGVGSRAPLPVVMAAWALLWVMYLSIVNVGQAWYSFGWESLLLEAGFLAIFLGDARTAPPVLIPWLACWLVFRVEFGAGLIKIRGDACWRNLTCLYYHHETQPMPGPLSWFFHHLPKPLHRIECAGNHVTQLVVPFGLFAPQPVAGIAAGVIIVTQLWLVASGNFAWLNWLTIVLAGSALDGPRIAATLRIDQPTYPRDPATWFAAAVLLLTATVLILSYWPVRNMLSRNQRMNQSFNRFHLVNSYGAFGSVGRTRREVVIEGSDTEDSTGEAVWREYEFKGKPGSITRMPRQWAPYHLRLDWLMWFAAISPLYAESWWDPFLARLLRNDPATLRLLRANPFPGRPPRYVRALLYEYHFSSLRELLRDGQWWQRSLVGVYQSPVTLAPGHTDPA